MKRIIDGVGPFNFRNLKWQQLQKKIHVTVRHRILLQATVPPVVNVVGPVRQQIRDQTEEEIE